MSAYMSTYLHVFILEYKRIMHFKLLFCTFYCPSITCNIQIELNLKFLLVVMLQCPDASTPPHLLRRVMAEPELGLVVIVAVAKEN